MTMQGLIYLMIIKLHSFIQNLFCKAGYSVPDVDHFCNTKDIVKLANTAIPFKLSQVNFPQKTGLELLLRMCFS